YEAGKIAEQLDQGKPGVAATHPVVFSPDGKRFAMLMPGPAGKPEVRVRVWPDGKLLHTFVGHPAAITAMVFSPDGKTLATGAQDSTVLVWDLTTIPA